MRTERRVAVKIINREVRQPPQRVHAEDHDLCVSPKPARETQRLCVRADQRQHPLKFHRANAQLGNNRQIIVHGTTDGDGGDGFHAGHRRYGQAVCQRIPQQVPVAAAVEQDANVFLAIDGPENDRNSIAPAGFACVVRGNLEQRHRDVGIRAHLVHSAHREGLQGEPHLDPEFFRCPGGFLQFRDLSGGQRRSGRLQLRIGVGRAADRQQ